MPTFRLVILKAGMARASSLTVENYPLEVEQTRTHPQIQLRNVSHSICYTHIGAVAYTIDGKTACCSVNNIMSVYTT